MLDRNDMNQVQVQKSTGEKGVEGVKGQKGSEITIRISLCHLLEPCASEHN